MLLYSDRPEPLLAVLLPEPPTILVELLLTLELGNSGLHFVVEPLPPDITREFLDGKQALSSVTHL